MAPESLSKATTSTTVSRTAIANLFARSCIESSYERGASMGRIQNSVKFAGVGGRDSRKVRFQRGFDRIPEGTHYACVWQANSQAVERDERPSTLNHRASP